MEYFSCRILEETVNNSNNHWEAILKKETLVLLVFKDTYRGFKYAEGEQNQRSNVFIRLYFIFCCVYLLPCVNHSVSWVCKSAQQIHIIIKLNLIRC